jgi:hypothetical protein
MRIRQGTAPGGDRHVARWQDVLCCLTRADGELTCLIVGPAPGEPTPGGNGGAVYRPLVRAVPLLADPAARPGSKASFGDVCMEQAVFVAAVGRQILAIDTMDAEPRPKVVVDLPEHAFHGGILRTASGLTALASDDEGRARIVRIHPTVDPQTGVVSLIEAWTHDVGPAFASAGVEAERPARLFIVGDTAYAIGTKNILVARWSANGGIWEWEPEPRVPPDFVSNLGDPDAVALLTGDDLDEQADPYFSLVFTATGADETTTYVSYSPQRPEGSKPWIRLDLDRGEDISLHLSGRTLYRVASIDADTYSIEALSKDGEICDWYSQAITLRQMGTSGSQMAYVGRFGTCLVTMLRVGSGLHLDVLDVSAGGQRGHAFVGVGDPLMGPVRVGDGSLTLSHAQGDVVARWLPFSRTPVDSSP